MASRVLHWCSQSITVAAMGSDSISKDCGELGTMIGYISSPYIELSFADLQWDSLGMVWPVKFEQMPIIKL